MIQYQIYVNNICYPILFNNIAVACAFLWEVKADCIVDAETGEIVAEREG